MTREEAIENLKWLLECSYVDSFEDEENEALDMAIKALQDKGHDRKNITSAVANKSTNLEQEKKLDTASNILAGGATVLTGTATVFNAMQISTIKKMAEIAQQCENLLK